ncbi:hypothetical protein HMPREF1545_01382 [Oscillibacter sp. KLE 1728]|nr:hypothetical protein HMPREF1545_01382 [Oscillibacter sp. KLE 1728]
MLEKFWQNCVMTASCHKRNLGVCFILGEVRYPAMSGVAAFQIQTESHRSQIIFM